MVPLPRHCSRRRIQWRDRLSMHVSHGVYASMHSRTIGSTYSSPARNLASVPLLTSRQSRRNADSVGCVIVVQNATLRGLHG